MALKPWLARQVYSLLLRLGTPVYLGRVWARGREEPAYRADWPWRMGWYRRAHREAVRRAGRHPVVWLHAVSLGEARAAAPLVEALRAQQPDMRLLLTHTTATGREAGRALMQEGDLQTWLPYDTPGAVRRFLRLHRPQVGVLMETEVWPNLQHEAQRAGVPMVLANARLSEKSLRQGMRLGVLLRPAAQAMSLCLAQTPADADRLMRMGAPVVRVVGNVKFDMTPTPALLAQGHAWQTLSERPMVLAASTREGEEPELLKAWLAECASLPVDGKRPRLCIVPRHPQRFDAVAAGVREAGLSLSRRSAWPDGLPDAQAQAAEVWLGDSMGEMPAYYAAACVALLGGSFAPLGGQNLIEAAACACPVVMGPSTFNFAEAAELSEQAGAALRVTDWREGVAQAVQLCEPVQHVPMAQRALDFAQAHRGAAKTMAEAIVSVARKSVQD